MRLDNYSVAAYEALEPMEGEGAAPGFGTPGETAHAEPQAEQAPSQLLAELARRPPAYTQVPEPPLRRLPRLGDERGATRSEPQERFQPGDGESGRLPNPLAPRAVSAPVTASPVVAAPAPVSPAPVAIAPAAATPPASVALPLGAAVNPEWLNQREAALKAVRNDFETAREAARDAPPADVASAAGTGWVPAPTDGDGNPVNGAVFVPDAAVATPESVPAWQLREGVILPAPAGQWLSFDDGAYEQVYRERLAARPEASAPLAKLARLYDQPVQSLLAGHPDLWTLATQDHALNAGPPPHAGVAMGDAASLGQLDLYLADPLVTRLRTELGGSVAAPTSAVALEQQRLHGAARYAELTQFSQAMATVRQTHAAAMQAAKDSGGTGWIEVPMQFGTDPETGWPTGVYATVGDGEIQRDANGVPVLARQRVFDEAVFTNAWLSQGGLAQEAFARFYGGAHSQIVLRPDTTQNAGQPTWVSQASLDNPRVRLGDGGVQDGELFALDLGNPRRLNNDAAVSFDPELGWVTPSANLYQHRSFFDKAMPIAMVAFVSWMTAGAASAANWGYVGSAAAAGAAASFTSGAIHGNLSLKGVLIGAVSGALTAGLTPELTGVLKDAGMGAAAGVAARMTVQGGIQALLGGKFKDGAIAGFASGLAELTGESIKTRIDEAVKAGTMTTAEAFAARSFNTVLGSAIRAAGSPGDPAHAFAQDWLGSLMQNNLPAPPRAAPAPANGDGDGVQTFPVPAPGPVEVTPLPGSPPPMDPGELAGQGSGGQGSDAPSPAPTPSSMDRVVVVNDPRGGSVSVNVDADASGRFKLTLDNQTALIRTADGQLLLAQAADAAERLPTGAQVLGRPGQTLIGAGNQVLVFDAGTSAQVMQLGALLNLPTADAATAGQPGGTLTPLAAGGALALTGAAEGGGGGRVALPSLLRMAGGLAELNLVDLVPAANPGLVLAAGLVYSPSLGGPARVESISDNLRLVTPTSDVREGALQVRVLDADGRERWMELGGAQVNREQAQQVAAALPRTSVLSPDEVRSWRSPLIYVPAPRNPNEGQLPLPPLDPKQAPAPPPGYGSTDPLPPFQVPGLAGHAPHWSDFILTKDGDRVYVPSRTEPTGQMGGAPTGPVTANLPNANPGNKADIEAENRALAAMANAGYRTERNPTLTQAERDAQGLSEDKNPDARIEGKVFDVKASRSAAAAQSAIEDSVAKGQARRFVISTENFQNPEADARELAARLRDAPAEGLLEVKVIVDGVVRNIYP